MNTPGARRARWRPLITAAASPGRQNRTHRDAPPRRMSPATEAARRKRRPGTSGWFRSAVHRAHIPPGPWRSRPLPGPVTVRDQLAAHRPGSRTSKVIRRRIINDVSVQWQAGAGVHPAMYRQLTNFAGILVLERPDLIPDAGMEPGRDLLVLSPLWVAPEFRRCNKTRHATLKAILDAVGRATDFGFNEAAGITWCSAPWSTLQRTSPQPCDSQVGRNY